MFLFLQKKKKQCWNDLAINLVTCFLVKSIDGHLHKISKLGGNNQEDFGVYSFISWENLDSSKLS